MIAAENNSACGLLHDEIQINFGGSTLLLSSRQFGDNVGAMIVNDITRCCHLLRAPMIQ